MPNKKHNATNKKMNLANYYYYFESALPPKLCDDIIRYGTAHKTETAITGGVDRDDGSSRKD